MNYLKSLVEPLFNSQFGVGIRNWCGFKPAAFVLPSRVDNFSCSDLFFGVLMETLVPFFDLQTFPRIILE